VRSPDRSLPVPHRPTGLSVAAVLRGLRMQVDRLEANRSAITGWTGDEAQLDEIVAAIRAEIDWIENHGFSFTREARA